MNRYLVIGVSSLAMVTGAQAADLMVLPAPTQTVDTSFVSSPIYFQLLGGAALGTDVTFYSPGAPAFTDATHVGYAIAGTVGINVFDGLSVEADVLRTFREEVAAGLDTYGTTSVMANVKYSLPVTDSVGLYAAAGVGYIWVDNFDGPPVNTSVSFDGFGYQLIAGTSFDFTENVAALAEVRYQDTFTDYDLGGGNTVDIPTVSILAGLKLSF